MMEASHLSSISRRVASGVDFLVGMTEAGGAFFIGAGELVLAGAEAFEGAAGELLLVVAGLGSSGAGVLSVGTDTLGSVAEEDEASGATASGFGAGASASSWARAHGAAVKTQAVRTRIVIFIGKVRCELVSPSRRRLAAQQACELERTYFVASFPVKAVLARAHASPWLPGGLDCLENSPQNLLALLVLLAT